MRHTVSSPESAPRGGRLAHTVPVLSRSPSSRPRALGLLLLSALALGTAVAVPAPASAQSSSTVTAAADYATEMFGDPWDFANTQDLLLDTGPTMKLEQPRITGGQLQFGLRENGYISPVWGGYPGGLYLDREAGAPERQLDADRYTHFSMHAFASESAAAGLNWWSCEGLDPECQGGQPFLLRQGWNTYNILVKNGGFGLPQEWTGMMTGLRLAISPGQPIDVKIDWMRSYAPATTVTTPADSTWDLDADVVSNHPSQPGWGNVRCVGQPVCDLSYLPAGTYHLADGDSRRGPIVLRRPARPVILDPDAVGGAAYMADDPWTFESSRDVSDTANVGELSFGKRLEGVNGPPSRNDPHVWFSLRGGPIDPERFHRLTIRSGYEGIFRLEDEAGGGTMGRVVWHTPGSSNVQQSEDIVTYGGTRTTTLDLSDPDIHETDHSNEFDRFPWDAAPVVALRWDPNEDHGPRRWWVEKLALRADDEAGTSYRVRWHDQGFAPGSTVRLYYDTDDEGFDGVPLSPSLTQQPGTNAYDWNTRAVPPGRYWVYAVVDGAAGTGGSYSSGPVSVVGPTLTGQAPSPVVPLTRELLDACPQTRVPASGLRDVAAGSPHRAAVDCLSWWRVTQPTSAGYLPAEQVTRGQMASFLRRVVEGTDQSLPAGADSFGDDGHSTHAPAIDALARAGVVTGYGDGTYRPDEPVTRAQMATFLVRTAELRLGQRLAEPADYFTDDAISAHRVAIDKAAGAGITGGTSDATYSPDALVRRDQMASFLVRLLDVLVSDGRGTPPAG